MNLLQTTIVLGLFFGLSFLSVDHLFSLGETVHHLNQAHHSLSNASIQLERHHAIHRPASVSSNFVIEKISVPISETRELTLLSLRFQDVQK